MATDSTHIDVDLLADLESVFQRSPLLNSDSMLHGLLCALLSHPLELENQHWYKHVDVLIDRPSQKEKKAIISYARGIENALSNDEYKLHLPAEFDDEQHHAKDSLEYREKTSYIANWIDGYIYGYAVSSFIQGAKAHEDVQEWIDFLQNCQRFLQQYIASPIEDKAEQGEAEKIAEPASEEAQFDLVEITEFLRVSIYLSRDIWHQQHVER